MTRTLAAALLLAAVGLPAGCQRAAREQARARTASLEQALRPSFFATALRKMGGGHYHGTARFAVGPAGAPPEVVTTTTDVWLDRVGNYRLVESNDRDGGREIILAGRELSVALRYGKMIRRIAEEPEPTRLLEEALGSSFAAWEVVGNAADIQAGPPQLFGGTKAAQYLITKDSAPEPAAAPATAPSALRQWRGTVAVQQLSGSLLVDDSSGALVKSQLQAAFTLAQEGRPLAGTIDVTASVTEAAAVPPIERPASDELALRQRIVPEQKELLQGLRGQAPPPSAARPAKGPAKPAGKGKKP